MKKKSLAILIGLLITIGLVSAVRLPIIGGDKDVWGSYLNEYLLLEHTENGTHKNSTSGPQGEQGIQGLPGINGTDGEGVVDGILTTESIKTETTDGELMIQPSVDSNGRVRFFKNSEGAPKIFVYGKDSLGSQKRIWLGIYENDAYSESGGTTRAILGTASDTYPDANGIGFEIQSPDQIRITSVDGNTQRGSVRIAADTFTTIHSRTTAETDATNHIIFDREEDNDEGAVTIETNAGDLIIEAASGTTHLQKNADSSGRIRFFRNTLGNPMINIWGYDSGDKIQKYITIGLFNNPAAFTEAGSTSRAIITSGGNTEGTRNALEIQSPDQVRITAVDDILNEGKVRIASDTTVEIYTRASAEVDSANRLIIDNVGDDVSGDIELSNPAGNVVIDGGYTGNCSSNIVVVGGIIIGCA